MGPTTLSQLEIVLDARERTAQVQLDVALRAALGAEASQVEVLSFSGGQDKAGELVKLGPGQAAELFQREGQKVRAAKKSQASICIASSSSGRRRDEDIERISLLLLDCDNAGEPEKLLARLDSLGLAYVAHETWSSGWDSQGKADARKGGQLDPLIFKWHVLLFLEEPIDLRGAHPRTKDDIRREYRWLVGVFSELAGLRVDPPTVKKRCVGFDPCMYDVLGRLTFVGNRPHKTAPARKVWHREGLSISWDRLLHATGYYEWLASRSAAPPSSQAPTSPPPPALAPAPVAICSSGPEPSLGDKLIESFRVAGLLGNECRPGCYRVRCPWEGEHTEKSGGKDTSTVIWAAGGGHPGGFVCHHGHCTGRRAGAIREWFRSQYPADFRRIWARTKIERSVPDPGLTESDSIPVPEWVSSIGEDQSADQQTWPDVRAWLQTGARGGIKDTAENVARIIQKHPHLKGAVYYSSFSERPIWTRTIYDEEIGYISRIGEPVTDHDIINLRRWFSTYCGWEPSKDSLNDGLESVALKHQRHEVRDYLKACRDAWDGKQRVNDLGEYWGFRARDEFGKPTAEALMFRKWLLAAVRRVQEPGCQQDYAIVFAGGQGLGKSQALRALFGDKWIARGAKDLRTKDAQASLIGKWGIELAELTSFDNATQQLIKEYLDTQVDDVRLPYARRNRNIYRQCVFAGTTNIDDFIGDHTGGRRFWPIPIVRDIDLDSIRVNRDQIWGEIHAAYEDGELTYFSREEENALIRPLQDQRLRVEPVIAELVDAHIGELVDGRPTADNDHGQTGILDQLQGTLDATTEESAKREFEAAERMRRFTIWGLARANRFSQPDTAARHSRHIELCLKRLGISKGARVNERSTSGDRTKVREYVVPWSLVMERGGERARGIFERLSKRGIVMND